MPVVTPAHLYSIIQAIKLHCGKSVMHDTQSYVDVCILKLGNSCVCAAYTRLPTPSLYEVQIISIITDSDCKERKSSLVVAAIYRARN